MLKEMKTLRTINDVTLISLPHHNDENGDLIVLEGSNHIPFEIARVFVVRADINAIRGQHAHKECIQFLTCPKGKIEVVCDDGNAHSTYIIDEPYLGLLVPEGIWAQETYLEKDSVLTVLCNQAYVPDDYIRDYNDFIQYRKTQDSKNLKQEKR